MPVCEACIIKASFGKRDEKTFQNRVRFLCIECWGTRNSQKVWLLKKSKDSSSSLNSASLHCICSGKDGHLCLRCKNEEKANPQDKPEGCYGKGCSGKKENGRGGRFCLWCNLPLPSALTRAESRREYDRKHLHARSHSTYDRSPEDDTIDPVAQEAIDALWTSASSSLSRKKIICPPFDPFEDERKQQVKAVSERRRQTASTAEEERWRMSSRSSHMDSSQRADPATRPIRLHRSDSTASTLVPRNDSSPPSYKESTGDYTTKDSDRFSQIDV
ncbi:hypothetical protein MMC28_007501 [Mycoblastus sanguinarius]|nr:hypothetical protein [Mycoblastus sanguinarius]